MTETAGAATASELASRDCAHCSQTFTYPKGAHRPPTYCSRVWDEAPRTCQARAKARRMGLRAAGMEIPVQALREDSGQVLPAIEALREVLDTYAAGVRDLETAALGRAREAEEEMREAVDRAEAETVRRQAAERAAEEARVAAAHAAEALLVAERRVRDAEKHASEAIAEERRKTWDHETARATAEARAAEASTAARHAVDERRAADQRERETGKRNDALQRDLAAAKKDLGVAEKAITTITNRAEKAEATAAAVTAERDAARADVARQDGELVELRSQLDAARASLAQASKDITAATTRAERADATTAAITGQLAETTSRLQTVEATIDELRSAAEQARIAAATADARAEAADKARIAAERRLDDHLAAQRQDPPSAGRTR